jgi:ornithine--oxo-acid transaminase
VLRAIHGGIFGQIVVMWLFRDFGFLIEVCGNHFMMLKAAPPLVVRDEQVDAFAPAVREVAEPAHAPGAFWAEALGPPRGARFAHEPAAIRLQFLTRAWQSL